MLQQFKRKLKKAVKPLLRNKKIVIVFSIIVFCAGILAYTEYMQNRRLVVNPATYKSVLDVIARAESNGNYNAYFGNAGNDSVDFTKMSIADVQKWQAEFIARGNASSAVGRYQIIDTTLSGLVRRLGIDTDQKFDQSMQDKLAVSLLERRGSVAYVNAEMTRDEFAASLAKEWAGLPKMIGENPTDSYYASDGLNKSRVSIDDVRKAVERIAAK